MKMSHFLFRKEDIMNENAEKYNRNEILERYCHVIDRNTVIINTGEKSPVCINKARCDMNGGCKNEKYNLKGTSLGKEQQNQNRGF